MGLTFSGPHWFFWTFLLLFCLHQGWETILTLLNNAQIRRNRETIPEYFRDKIEPDRYQKAVRYNLDRARFGLVVRGYDILIVWALILTGLFETVEHLITVSLGLEGLMESVAYCGAFALLVLVIKIPVSLYSHFVLEARYGFNRMTLGTFLLDLVKEIGLGVVLGGPLLLLVFWLYRASGPLWWIWAFGAVFGFEFLVAAVYPTLLAPIFNRFTPLPDGTLKEAILTLAKKIRFRLSGIYTIDGSRRSAHSNAYFAGIGGLRRIVLFDTLQAQMSEPEIVAVLGHEMGHNKRWHVQKQLALSFVVSLAGFWILSLVIEWPPFYTAFNAGSPAPHKALVLAALFGGNFCFFLPALVNTLSRKYEYEADRFAVEVTGNPSSMASALVSLSRENLSNLTPHPLYSFYHYTHPTPLERIRAIEGLASK